MMIHTNVHRFRKIGMIEGYSYLILLFVAMPIKYFLGFPLAVKIVGMTHGILFILFCILLIKAWQDTKWSAYESTIYFTASLIPFGTFYTDKMLKKYE